MNSKAFSLIELSIVLVILGLLTGGILSGQSLIRASELRSVTMQYQRYTAATQSFRDKYFALPGDMNNAISFWGTSANCPGTSAQGSTDSRTCNGDGSGTVGTTVTSAENFRFWQHLANAVLIEGSYNGVQAGPGIYSAATSNSPTGRLGNSLWFAHNWGTISSSTTVFDGQYDNFLLINGITSNYFPTTPLFKPEEAWNVDAKLDDGKPATGKVVTYSTGFSTCTDASASSNLTANYLLSGSAPACGTVFRQAF